MRSLEGTEGNLTGRRLPGERSRNLLYRPVGMIVEQPVLS